MKALQVVEPGKAVFRDVDPPQPKPGYAVIRPHKLALCGSDIRMLHYAPPELYPFPVGTTGHEMVGTIEQIDADAPFRKGDLTLTLVPGHRAMCELYQAPYEHIVPLPKGKPLEQLLQGQQLATVIYACKRLLCVTGKNVAVVGQGSAGLWFDFHLRRLGARRILALDLEPRRLELSAHFGATHFIHNDGSDMIGAVARANDGQLPDLVIEAAGEVDSINLAVELVRKNGQLLFFGVPRAKQIPFNINTFFHKCCHAATIVGVVEEPDLTSTRLALDIIAKGEIDVAPLITHHFEFNNVLEAYELHRTRADGAVKIVIDMPT